jgi:leucyl-tRNA synthetase
MSSAENTEALAIAVSPAEEPEREQRYSPAEIEPRWQQRWAEDPALYAAEPHSTGKPKYYVLEMLPYPSGQLHMGHVRNYAIGDALARYMWMRGYNVLHPMGWDAFGLPAENAAIKNNTPPREWTLANIAAMKRQFQRLGFGFDWATEITTCFPDYYRWNQWFFVRMYERGLAYRKKSKVNWCPQCMTVLANEQVIDGMCWRHEDQAVEQRDLEQWFLRTTEYAQELLDGLDKLPHWPEKVRTMQSNWIGRSEGATVEFAIDPTIHEPSDSDSGLAELLGNLHGRKVLPALEPVPAQSNAAESSAARKIAVFTTRIDTIFGATSLQLAPEHPVVAEFAAQDHGLAGQVSALIEQQARAREAGDIGAIEKHGAFTGRYAINPFSGERVPIWVANYVLRDYGTGAIMSVPAHDERDYEFAKKYGLEVRIVVLPRRKGGRVADGEAQPPVLPYTEEDSLLINSGAYNTFGCQEAQQRMAAYAEEHGFGKPTVTYRLKDWGVSRQRYWGTPIPMLYCEKDGIVPVPDDQLPILLPEQVTITLQGGSPLGNIPEFVNATCPKCGGPARRETDTMDTFVDSSWYFYRYTSAKDDKAPFDTDAVTYWFPIDQYIGGVEHAILHLIYSRFWTKMMRDMGLVSNDEPATRQFSQGMVIKDHQKMSKSKGNIVSPDDMVERYGADATRMYSLFAAPPDRDLDWQEDGVAGVSRFLAKVYRFVNRHAETARATGESGPLSQTSQQLLRKLHQTIRQITLNFDERWKFNTCIAALMKLMNEVVATEPQIEAGEVSGAVLGQILDSVVLMLSPFAPYLAAELWEQLGNEQAILRHPWAAFDEVLAREDNMEIPVQINGKLRAVIRVPIDISEESLRDAAMVDEKVQHFLDGKQVFKAIIVPGKLVNLLVK